MDVNNAFLSWTAVEMLKQGSNIDIRTIPAIIGGDEAKRKGVDSSTPGLPLYEHVAAPYQTVLTSSALNSNIPESCHT